MNIIWHKARLIKTFPSGSEFLSLKAFQTSCLLLKYYNIILLTNKININEFYQCTYNNIIQRNHSENHGVAKESDLSELTLSLSHISKNINQTHAHSMWESDAGLKMTTCTIFTDLKIRRSTAVWVWFSKRWPTLGQTPRKTNFPLVLYCRLYLCRNLVFV